MYNKIIRVLRFFGLLICELVKCWTLLLAVLLNENLAPVMNDLTSD